MRKRCLEDAEEDKKQGDDGGAVLMLEEDCHDSINAKAYESWFEKRLCPNLDTTREIAPIILYRHGRKLNCPTG